MDRLEFRRILDRLKRSSVSAELVGFYQEVERLHASVAKATATLPLASPLCPKQDRTTYMRLYMRSYRARMRGQTMNEQRSKGERKGIKP